MAIADSDGPKSNRPQERGLDVQKSPFHRLHSLIPSALLLVYFVVCPALNVQASEQHRNIICRPGVSTKHRNSLTNRLRSITGWNKLGFDADGALRLGNSSSPAGGSTSARDLLALATAGQFVFVLEDASSRSDVVFARVTEGRWTHDSAGKPPVQIILVDFTDFTHVIGDSEALASFNEGWAILHEIAHVVHNSVDARNGDEVGECEGLINKMRRECGLAERVEYFFRYFPGQENSSFQARFVRIPFERQTTRKKKRLWVMWDGTLVGGLDASTQVVRN